MIAVRRCGFLAAFVFLVVGVAGCKHRPTDEEAIRAAVRQRLVSLGTLNLQAMDLDFTRVAIQDNQATAEVSFRPKTGTPADAVMQVAYLLEKRDGLWRVVKTSGAGGMIQHPDPSSDPHTQGVPGSATKLPNFQDVLGGSSSSGANSAPSPSQTDAAPSAKP